MLMKFYIYILRDPLTGMVRYVGKTNNLHRRNWQHSNGTGNARFLKWRDHLKTKGYIPLLEVVAECDESNWHLLEAEEIRTQRALGAKLLNVQRGVFNRFSHEWTKLLLEGPLVLPAPHENCRFLIDAPNGERYQVHGSPFTSGKYFYVYPFPDSGARYHLPKESIAYEVPCGFSDFDREYHGAQVNKYLLQIEAKRALLPYLILEGWKDGELYFLRVS